MATRDSNIIVFVIIHDNELRDGGFFWLNLILKKYVVLGIYPLKCVMNRVLPFTIR